MLSVSGEGNSNYPYYTMDAAICKPFLEKNLPQNAKIFYGRFTKKLRIRFGWENGRQR